MIVDSSKLITCGLILNRIPNVDISVLHLVRDSRAVAYSWQRKKLRPEIHWKQEYVPKCSPFESSRDWMMFNLMTRRLISEVGKPSLFLRYEDAVANPDAMTRRVQSFFAQQGTHVEFPSYESGVIRVLTNHTVAGNPIRLGRDEIRLRADMEWLERCASPPKADGYRAHRSVAEPLRLHRLVLQRDGLESKVTFYDRASARRFRL